MKLARPRQWLEGYLEKALIRGASYTSLDAMKLFAIVNMTCDHIGYFFYPHELWWRAIGRITFPVWFFLAGYSRSRGVGWLLWTYALLLILLKPCLGHFVFPLNALVSIILCRLLLNLCEDRGWLNDKLPHVVAACVLLTPITTPLFEYGSIAFLFALFGRLIIKKQKQHLSFLMIISYLTFIFWQFAWFKFHLLQGAYVVVGTCLVTLWLATFTNSVVWPDWRESSAKTFIAVLSRNTLPYYFYHRLIFEVAAALMDKHGIHIGLKI